MVGLGVGLGLGVGVRGEEEAHGHSTRYSTRLTPHTTYPSTHDDDDHKQAHVKRGGVLVYATCSLLAQENERVAAWFLREFGGRFRALDWGDGPVRFFWVCGVGVSMDNGVWVFWSDAHDF